MHRPTFRLLSWLLVGVLGLVLAAAEPADARKKKKKKRVRPTTTAVLDMQRSGADPDAQGVIRIAMSSRSSWLTADFSGLDPNTAYSFRVGGQDRALVGSDAEGRARLQFGSPLYTGAQPLDFDPRKERLSLVGAGGTLLQTSLMGPHSRSGADGSESAALSRSASAPSRSVGGASYRVTTDGTQSTSISATGLAPGRYDVYAGGQWLGEMTVAVDRKLKRKYRKKSKKARKRLPAPTRGTLSVDSVTMGAPLDALGESVEVFDGDTMVLGGPLLGPARGVSSCAESELERFLPRLVGTGSAEARFRIRDDCRRDFQVELEDVAPGSYAVIVSGVQRGTLVAAVDPFTGAVEGELEFDTEPDDPGELLLDFEPLGANVSIRQGATVLFEGVFDASLGGAGGAGGAGGGGSCSESEIRQPMAPTAAAPGADGDARFRTRDDCRQDFRVEAEDVPVGTYTLRVGGIVRGSFAVVPVPGGTEGEIDFDTEPDPDERPLDFDPRGQTIEVLNASGAVVLTTPLGGGVGGAGGGGAGGGGGIACAESELSRVLINAGPAPLASGDARLRVDDDCREDFRVEAEDVPVGSYRLFVAGIDRGPINVVNVVGGTEGEIEFDTHPDDPGERLLDFDPRGALIEVRQGATVFLTRVLE